MHRPDQAAEKIEELLDNPELCREMGSRGVKYAVQNSWPLQSSKLVALIEKILCQK
jgi:glycosyltransferase involved in cell wall biosynthesis